MVLPSLIRGGVSGTRVARAAVGAAGTVAARSSRVPPAAATARRRMGGHARHVGLPTEHVPIKDVRPIHQHLGTAYAVLAFVWMMYRCKEDGAALIGLEHPWDHMHHDDHDTESTYKFEEEEEEEEDEDEEEEEEEEEE